MSDKPNEYVLGFIFDLTGQCVLLKLKGRPDWQANKFNGIGGHVRQDETPLDAMRRECDEETNSGALPWRLVCFLRGTWGIVSVFAVYAQDIGKIESAEDEPVEMFKTDALPDNCIPNVRWLVPMCLSFARGEHARYFEIKEVA